MKFITKIFIILILSFGYVYANDTYKKVYEETFELMNDDNNNSTFTEKVSIINIDEETAEVIINPVIGDIKSILDNRDFTFKIKFNKEASFKLGCVVENLKNNNSCNALIDNVYILEKNKDNQAILVLKLFLIRNENNTYYLSMITDIFPKENSRLHEEFLIEEKEIKF